MLLTQMQMIIIYWLPYHWKHASQLFETLQFRSASWPDSFEQKKVDRLRTRN